MVTLRHEQQTTIVFFSTECEQSEWMKNAVIWINENIHVSGPLPSFSF